MKPPEQPAEVEANLLSEIQRRHLAVKLAFTVRDLGSLIGSLEAYPRPPMRGVRHEIEAATRRLRDAWVLSCDVEASENRAGQDDDQPGPAETP